MFLGDGQMQRDCLRQGDILRGIPFPLLEQIDNLLGLAKLQSSDSYFSPPGVEFAPTPNRNDHNWFTVAFVKMRLCYCAVLSNCCELEMRGKMMPHSLSVARLIPIDPNFLKDADTLAIIKASSDPREGKQYLRYFYIGPQKRLEDKEWLVDFSQILTLPRTELQEVLKRKLLQMDDRSRVKFKIRAGWYLTRTNKEEIRDGLEDPWAGAGEATLEKEGFWGRLRAVTAKVFGNQPYS
jgi:hypothetical protein